MKHYKNEQHIFVIKSVLENDKNFPYQLGKEQNSVGKLNFC